MSKILIVEDDPVLQEMYKDKFTSAGYEVHATAYGLEGISLMKQINPDLMLLDLILPDTTGFSVLDTVSSDPSVNTIPIIVMTNIYADGEDLVKNHGVKSFVLKSNSTPNQILEKVKVLLGQK
jgi:CheY-like chemotaxis protein